MNFLRFQSNSNPIKRADPKLVLETLASVSSTVLSKCFTPDCCIGATKIGIEVLRRFQITGRPMLTAAVAMNAAYYHHVTSNSTQPPPSDARILVIDDEIGSSDIGYAGHLVIVGKIPGSSFLLDLSASQFNRPKKDIVIDEALLIEMPVNTNFDGEVLAPLTRGYVVYGPHPKLNDRSWRDSPDWTLPTAGHREIYKAVCDELEQRVVEGLR